MSGGKLAAVYGKDSDGVMRLIKRNISVQDAIQLAGDHFEKTGQSAFIVEAEEEKMTVKFTKPTDDDIRDYQESLGTAAMLEGRVKIVVEDSRGEKSYTFMEDEKFELLGEEYIRSHATLLFDSFLDAWFVGISENDFHNDQKRNPEKIIHLVFDGMEGGSGREVYKEVETGRYFLREDFYPREEFARWYVCGKQRHTDDGDEPRANLIFECNGQFEKVIYDDWNGVAAYSKTYNRRFNTAVGEQDGAGAAE